MQRIFSVLLLLTLGLGVSCGGDDDDGGDPGPIGGSDGAPTDNVDCDPEEATTCQNEQDCPFVIDGTARVTAGTCGQGCLGKEESCAVECITAELAMSQECATCYAQTVACTVQNCLSECLADTEAEKCKVCQVDSGCRAAFNDCSGLPE
jgi:hypothetical protein